MLLFPNMVMYTLTQCSMFNPITAETFVGFVLKFYYGECIILHEGANCYKILTKGISNYPAV